MNLTVHLQIAGVLVALLVPLNLYVPLRFAWRQEMAGLSLLNRQIFLVHHGFILLTLTLLSALTLFHAPSLLEPTPLARALLGGMTLFWGTRLLVQWFVYDRRIWRGHRFNTVMHFVFTGLWAYLAGTNATALWWNLKAG